MKLGWVQEQLGELLAAVAHSHQGAQVAVVEVTSCRWVAQEGGPCQIGLQGQEPACDCRADGGVWQQGRR